MHPMSSLGESDHSRVAKVPCASILVGIGCPALIAIAEQCRTAYGMPQLLQFLLRNIHWREHAHIVVEFPAPRAVLVAAGGVSREVLRLVRAEVLILAAHPLQSVCQRGVAARAARTHGTPIADPFLPPLMQG